MCIQVQLLFCVRLISGNVHQATAYGSMCAMLSDAAVKWYAKGENTENKLAEERTDGRNE